MKHIHPLISIVIPVFNREDLISDCINSCLNQTYYNFEIIVFDNNSSDRTYEIAQSFGKKHNNIRVFKQEQNVGPVMNWLSAIEAAKGEYLKILFSDDIIYEDFLYETFSKIDNDIGFVLSSYDMGAAIDDSKFQNDWQGIDGLISSKRYIEMAIRRFAFCVSPGAALFRTKDVLEVFEDEIPSPSLSNFKSHGAGPDLLIFLKIASKYENIYKIGKSLTFFRSHDDSQTIKMNSEKNGLIQSSYMQARIYFASNYDKKFFGRSLGKAFFVELFQNNNYRVLNVNYLVDIYSFNKDFRYIDVLIGFILSIFDAFQEVIRRLSLSFYRN